MMNQSRLDATTGPAKPGRILKKPFGRGFWALVAIFLFVGPALAVIIFGQLIYNAVSSDEPAKTPLPISGEESAPAPPVESEPVPANPDEDPVYQDEAGVWRNTKRGERPEPYFLETAPEAAAGPEEPLAAEPQNLLTLGLKLLSGGQDWSNPSPSVKLAQADRFYQDENGVWRNTGAGVPPPSRTEHIYQDENGVWRNLSQGSGPDSAVPAPVTANPATALLGGLLSQSGGTTADGAPIDLSASLLGGDLGTLMGSLMGSPSAGGDDLGALMGFLMGSGQGGGGDLGALLGSLTGSGQGGGLGDLSALMGQVLGAGQGGDLSGLLNGVMSSMAPLGSLQAVRNEESAPLNVIRVRPQPFNSQARGQAASITSNGAGLNIEGYERFDPAKAGEIKSEWEFFDDPR